SPGSSGTGTATAGTGSGTAGSTTAAGTGSGGTPGAGGTASGTAGSGGAATTGGTGTGGSTGGTPSGIAVNLASEQQTMDGFGINDVFQPAFSTTYLDTLFGTGDGQIGLTILRVGMSSDGSLTNGADAGNDVKGASMRGVKTFIGSAWTAPGDCKTNGQDNGGGFIKDDTCLDSWSKTIAAFPAKFKTASGVDLTAMSPANEPDFASCGLAEPCNGNYATMLWKASDAVKLVNKVGPLLKALNPPVKLITPEASEWVHLWSNDSATGSVPSNKPSSNPLMGKDYDYGHAFFADKTAWGNIDIIGVHQYDSQKALSWPADVTEKKPIWETEMSGVAWWPEQGPSSDIANGVVVAGWIHDAIVNGPASAWLWWWPKPLADSGGGNITNDNEGLWLQNGMKTKRLYTLGNYSKFVRPGYKRVDITGNTSADLLLTAFKGTDGTVVIVAINKGAAAVTVPITISGTAPAMLTPWVTSATDDLVKKTAIAVSGGAFMAALDTKTVTTFVGK
ncbi:MAG TPA: glycoside hydrolase family 30 beta sandwich domain-containing protein, partial [Polyangiaceae bacterium]|nr:glycoside hydrolase family 30 beta sandwich domain-containing protein [Polyangiaceae bacterium]